MRGSIKQVKSGVWRLRVDRMPDPVTGARRQSTHTVHGTKWAAQNALKKLLVAVDEDSDMRLGACLEEWILHTCKRSSSPVASERAKRSMMAQLPDWLTGIKLSQLSAAHLDRYYNEAMDARGTAAIAKTHSQITACLSQAVKWGWVSKNVATQASPPTHRRDPIVVPDLDQVRAIVDYAAASTQPEMATVVTLLTLTGMRRGELCGLRWSDIDYAHCRASIQRSIWQSGGDWGIKVPKTAGSQRVISLDPVAMGVLRGRRERAESGAKLVARSLTPESYVMGTSPDGLCPLKPTAVTQFVSKAAKALNLHGVHAHSLRHTGISLLVSEGVDIRTVANRAGHSDPSMTLRVYSALQGGKDAQAAAMLGKMLSS